MLHETGDVVIALLGPGGIGRRPLRLLWSRNDVDHCLDVFREFQSIGLQIKLETTQFEIPQYLEADLLALCKSAFTTHPYKSHATGMDPSVFLHSPIQVQVRETIALAQKSIIVAQETAAVSQESTLVAQEIHGRIMETILGHPSRLRIGC